MSPFDRFKRFVLRLFYDDDVLEETSRGRFTVTKSNTAISKFKEFWISKKGREELDNLDDVLQRSSKPLDTEE